MGLAAGISSGRYRLHTTASLSITCCSVICQFHDDRMRVGVLLDDRVCSEWSAVEQGLRQGCVLAPLLFNIFFRAVINVAPTRVKADKGIMHALVHHLRTKRAVGGRGEATAGESVLATPVWGILCADDAGVISQSPERLRKMMGVIVVVCTAFGLTVPEANTEIMYLRAKGMPESIAILSVEAEGQVYNQTNEFVYLGENVNHNADLSIEVDRRIRNAWCSFRKYTLELYDRPSAPLELKFLNVEVLETTLYDCVTWSPSACHYDTLRRAHHGILTRCIGWRKHNNRADHPISYLDTLIKTGSESVEATLRMRRILFVRFLARIKDTRLPKCVMFGQFVGGADCVGGQEKEWMGCFLDGLRAFGINADQWTTAAQDEGNGAERRNKGGGTFHGEMDRCGGSQGWTTACSRMPELDGRDQGEDSPKQAGLCGFTRPC